MQIRAGTLAIALVALAFVVPGTSALGQGGTGAAAESGEAHDHIHSHGDDHRHDHGHDDAVYRGYFEDDQVQDRALRDWEGDWQSVYPYLVDGTLDPVMEQKALDGEKSAQDHRAYYEAGYRTQTDRIKIEGDTVRFFRGGDVVAARYAYDDHEVLTYEKGNRGVRYVFEKADGDSEAPRFIQFSDHRIAPETSDHYHLYWGEDRAALLEEVSHWPTFYPAALSGEDILAEMLAH